MSGSPTTLAVVKQANQGTGLEIVHQLAEEGNSIVLTACNTMCDIEATRSLKMQHRGLNRGYGWTCIYTEVTIDVTTHLDERFHVTPICKTMASKLDQKC